MVRALEAGIGDKNGDSSIAVFTAASDFPVRDAGAFRVIARQQAARKRRATTVPTTQSMALVVGDRGSAGVSRR
jgi:hypothetical protein